MVHIELAAIHYKIMSSSKIIIYQTPDGDTAIDVTLENSTIWLTQKQIADLFGTRRPAITKHLVNIFLAGELEEKSVCSVLEHTASDGKNYRMNFYNLDAILSVGYRVNSRHATQFRIWANKVLKEYLVQGYSINEKRLREQAEQFNALKHTVKLLGNVLDAKPLSTDEATGLLGIITNYTYALDILDRYDNRSLAIEATRQAPPFVATYSDAIRAITSLRQKFGGSQLFGNEKDESFKSSMAAIYQTFDGNDLYPSIEEKAAHLLYFIVKNHSFSDGNKRIAAFIFVWFLEKNNILYRYDGSKRIADNALVALTLMIAESKPVDKDIMTQVVINLINAHND